MKPARRLVPVVEISVPRPSPPDSKRPLSTSLPSVDGESQSSRKKQKLDLDCVDYASQFKPICISPTLSDFNDMENPPLSPTISDFTKEHSPSVTELMAEGGDDDSDGIFYEKEEELIIPGEIDNVNSNDDDGDVPVRLLSDFTIYDSHYNLVPIEELAQLEFSKPIFRASGLVTPWREDDEDEEIEEESVESEKEYGAQRVNLSTILELNVHTYDAETKVLDPRIYIRTVFAWYILDRPAPSYSKQSLPFWIRHRVFHLFVTAAVARPRITYQQFASSIDNFDRLEGNQLTATSTILGRELSRGDLETEEMTAYLLSSLSELSLEAPIHLDRVPMVRYISNSSAIQPIMKAVDHPSAQSKARKMITFKKSKPSLPTSVTPIISHVAKDLFKGLEMVGSSAFEEEVAAQMEDAQIHHGDPTTIRWGNQVSEQKYYDSVEVDGVWYEAGDAVMVNPGVDDNDMRARNAVTAAARSSNSFANCSWFARICYFFESDAKEKYFHAQWFEHASKTVLQETAHSKCLFFMDQCDDILVASIFQKCNVRMLADEDEVPLDDHNPEANDFHCGLMVKNSVDFIHLPRKNDISLEDLPAHKPCLSCLVRQKEEFASKPHSISQGFTLHHINYHIHDFVYVLPQDNSQLLDIAQVIKIDDHPGHPIHIRYFGRQSIHLTNVSQDHLLFDERQLYLDYRHAQITYAQLDGVCFIRYLTESSEIDDWVEEPNHFYVTHERDTQKKFHPLKKGKLSYCQKCDGEEMQKIQNMEIFLQRTGKLRGLELFSGAGGLGTGMDMSGFVDTRYAVEYMQAAASTYKLNHPTTKVYCQDTNLLLKHAIEAHEGNSTEPLLSNDGKTYCPAMPGKHDVDFIYGGPPCQSFSQANHHPRADDPRTSLVTNMLSYLEFYNADYFLLENVLGIIRHPLKSKQGTNRLEGGIQSGVMKFITCSLIALGYQVRFRVLQAGQYGAPQGRRRVIFWGAKRGLPLPDFPVPVYAFKPPHKKSLPTGESILPVSRSKNPDNPHGCAPMPFITVKDTLSDLPPFDWINPHIAIPASAHDRAEAILRSQQGIKQVSANKGGCPGFFTGIHYRTPPQNRFQKWLRREMIDDDGEEIIVEGHYTRSFHSGVVEATTTVPLRPDANNFDLPVELPQSGRRQNRKNGPGNYGRLCEESHFRCAMTTVNPSDKGSSILHPSQKRIITVREFARAQGFPDHYKFVETHKDGVTDQLKQIGNAVPIPLALALGKQLGAAVMKAWEERKEERKRQSSPII